MTCLDKPGKPKQNYPNKTAAERAKKQRMDENPTLDLRSYRCECGQFHLSHGPDRTGHDTEESAA